VTPAAPVEPEQEEDSRYHYRLGDESYANGKYTYYSGWVFKAGGKVLFFREWGCNVLGRPVSTEKGIGT
jgi:hypothetical protein